MESVDRTIMVCPLTVRPALACCDGVREDFPAHPYKPGQKLTCRFWTQMSQPGVNGEPVSKGDCAEYWTPIASLEAARMTRGVFAAVTEQTKASVDALPDEARERVIANATRQMLLTLTSRRGDTDQLLDLTTAPALPNKTTPQLENKG